MSTSVAKGAVAVMLGLVVGASTAWAQAPLVRMGLSTVGMGLFARNCATCHTTRDETGGDPRAPKMETLREYPPERILDALTDGKMKVQGASLRDQDRRELAEWISARYLGAATAGGAEAMPNRCPADTAWSKAPGWNGWGAGVRNSRYQTAAAAGLTAASLPRLKLKWAFGLPGGVQVFSQPTVAGGRLYIGSDAGQVYALDAATGCVRWSFLAEASVRTAPVVGPGPRPLLFVGDMRAKLYALDARTGRLVWSTRVDEQPLARISAAPTLYKGRLYVPISSGEEGAARLPGYECCRHRGSVVAVSAADGHPLWRTYVIPDLPRPSTDAAGNRRWGPAGGAVWSAPTVDAKRGRLYITTGDAYAGPAGRFTDAIVALDLADGGIVWSHQDTADDTWVAGCAAGGRGCPDKLGPDWDYAASAMLLTLPKGRDAVVSGHKGGVAMALDPDRAGALLWRINLATQPSTTRGDILFGGAADTRSVYFALQDSAALVSLDLATGARRWSVPIVPPAGRMAAAGAGAAVTAVPGAVLSGGWDGVLRAVSASSGKPLWSFDTDRSFDTVNGVAAKGGSMGGPGPTVAGGMLFVGSGYVGVNNGMPGNVLLAFGL
jgi:polyvinyl alcohol dehydrogenase (cytochrome)